MGKIKQIMLLLMLMVFIAAGCSSNEPAVEEAEETTTVQEADAAEASEETGELTYDGELSFTGDLGGFSVPYNEIYAMPSVATEVSHVSSSGETSVNNIVGVKLEDILIAQGATKQDCESIRFIAGDGYAVSMAWDIFSAKDVILAYEFDGETLDEKKMPLRVAVDEERSMYYVSNLVEVELSAGSGESAEAAQNKVVIMETAFAGMTTEDYMYYDSNDQAVKVNELLSAHMSGETEQVGFIASDGYEKTEDFNVVKDGYIKVDGEDAPLFTGKDLPKGMNVKYIMKMSAGDATFVSVNSAMDSLEQVSFDDDNGVSLSALVAMAGLEGEGFLLTADDGYTKEINGEQLAVGMAYVNNGGTVTVKFNDDNPKKSKVKNLLTIEATSAPSTETASEATEDVVEVEGWMVTFDGLSDGSFDFDRDRAERKLEKVDLHTEHTKNEEKKPNDWEGYKVLDILDWLRVEDFSSITVVAGDGYEVELLKEMVDETTILADVRNGEALTDEDNRVQLVQDTEFATTWVKGVARIVVNQ